MKPTTLPTDKKNKDVEQGSSEGFDRSLPQADSPYSEDEMQPAQKRNFLQRLKTHPYWRVETFMVVGAVITGLLSAYLSQANQTAYRTQLEAAHRTTPVLVAKSNLGKGTRLSSKNLRSEKRLVRGVSSNWARQKNFKMILGKTLVSQLKAGDPILLSNVQGASSTDRVIETIPPGKRLFTLSIASKATSYGWIKAGDHVDVLANINLPGRGQTSMTMLQDITLVSVGASSIVDTDGKSSGTDISFYVTPKDVEFLSFAQQNGKFSVSLRNPKDVANSNLKRGIDIKGFLDHKMISEQSGGGDLEVIENGVKVRKKRKRKG